MPLFTVTIPCSNPFFLIPQLHIIQLHPQKPKCNSSKYYRNSFLNAFLNASFFLKPCTAWVLWNLLLHDNIQIFFKNLCQQLLPLVCCHTSPASVWSWCYFWYYTVYIYFYICSQHLPSDFSVIFDLVFGKPLKGFHSRVLLSE